MRRRGTRLRTLIAPTQCMSAILQIDKLLPFASGSTIFPRGDGIPSKLSTWLV